eukprot:3216092-Amphidinium_carterae.1
MLAESDPTGLFDSSVVLGGMLICTVGQKHPGTLAVLHSRTQPTGLGRTFVPKRAKESMTCHVLSIECTAFRTSIKDKSLFKAAAYYKCLLSGKR